MEPKVIVKDTDESKDGLTYWMAVFFIVGNMAGSGVLVLPRALADSGWGGLLYISFCCVNSLYAGICLARCWNILEERYEEYRRRHRYPYPAIAYEAYGLKMRYFVSVCVEISFIGVAIVFLLLSASLISRLVSAWGIYFCYWVIIIAAILCPLMWLGTPKDFGLIAILIVVTVIAGVFFIFIAVARHAFSTTLQRTYDTPTFLSFFLSIGTINFAFGGSANFPTFQNDMRDKKEFLSAITVGFVILFLMYLPVAVTTYAVYGDKIEPDITANLPHSIYRSIIIILMAVRTIFAFILIINASCQEFEEIFNVPSSFGWKRVVLRGTILLIMLFIALSIPRFGKILNLVGGSVIALVSSVFPCLFYIKLCAQTNQKWPERVISTSEYIYLVVIMANGILGGAIATYSAVVDLIHFSTFNPPCYVNISSSNN